MRTLSKMHSLKISLGASWVIACYSAIVSASELPPTSVLASTTTTTSSYPGTNTSYETISDNSTFVTVIEYDPIPRTTVTRGWYAETTETTVYNCGDIEDNGLSALPVKRDNPYTQECDPMNTITTMITEVVHVPIVTSTIQVPYTGEEPFTLYSLDDGAVTETDIVYVPNAACETAGASCGTSAADAAFGSQTACCQFGLRCATESVDITCVPATSQVTYYWTSAETMTTTYTTYINGLPSVVVEVDEPIITKTVTSSGDADYTTTLTTIEGNITAGTATVIIEVPYSKEYYNSTSVTGWTGTVTSTYATSSTVIKGSNGIDTISTIYYVETPQSHGISTTCSPWSGTFTSTYATVTSTIKGSDGVDTVSTIYYVETPQAHAVSTIYSAWSGTITSTYATAMTTIDGADGVDTVNTIYYVNTPGNGYYGNSTAASSASTAQSDELTSTLSISVTEPSRPSTSGSQQQITSGESSNSAPSSASNKPSSAPYSTPNKLSSASSDEPRVSPSGLFTVSSAESVASSSLTSNEYSRSTATFSTARVPSDSGEPAVPVSVSSSATSIKRISQSAVTTIGSGTVTSYTTTCPVTNSQTEIESHDQVAESVVTTTVNGIVTSYTTTCPIGTYHKETLSKVIQAQTSAATLVPGNHTSTLGGSQGSVSGAAAANPQPTASAARDSSLGQFASTSAASLLSFSNAASSTAESKSAATLSLIAVGTSGAPVSGANATQGPSVVNPMVISGPNGASQTTVAISSASASPADVSTSTVRLSTYAGSAAKLRAPFMLLLPLAVL